MKQLTYHFFANYLIQMLICIGAAVRAAVRRPDCAADSETARALTAVYTAILKNLAGEFADMSQHQQASHVLDCILYTASPVELLDVADEIGQSGAVLLATQWGFKVMQRVVDRLVRAIRCWHSSADG